MFSGQSWVEPIVYVYSFPSALYRHCLVMPVVRSPVLNAVSVWALTAPVAPKAKAATIESVTRMRIVLFSRCEALPSPRCRTVGPAPNIGCSVSDGRHAADTQGPM